MPVSHDEKILNRIRESYRRLSFGWDPHFAAKETNKEYSIQALIFRLYLLLRLIPPALGPEPNPGIASLFSSLC